MIICLLLGMKLCNSQLLAVSPCGHTILRYLFIPPLIDHISAAKTYDCWICCGQFIIFETTLDDTMFLFQKVLSVVFVSMFSFYNVVFVSDFWWLHLVNVLSIPLMFGVESPSCLVLRAQLVILHFGLHSHPFHIVVIHHPFLPGFLYSCLFWSLYLPSLCCILDKLSRAMGLITSSFLLF